MPAKLRLTVELDLTSPYVEDRRYEQLCVALFQLTQLPPDDDPAAMPELYPDHLIEHPGWTHRPITVQTPEGMVTIGSFEVATIPTLSELGDVLTARLNSAKDA